MSSTAQSRQAKNHAASPEVKAADAAQKASYSAKDAARLPAWTSAWNNQPAIGLISPLDLQTQGLLSQPGDTYEREAERVAEQIMHPTSSATAPMAPPPDSSEMSSSLVDPLSHVSPMIQRAPVEGEVSSTSATGTTAPEPTSTLAAATAGTAPEDIVPDQTSTPGMIVEDDVDQLQAGQMKKSDFLAQLRVAICTTTEEALKGTIWSAAGCPWVDYWFGYYSNRNSQQIERALRRYSSETASATSASDYIPILCERVRRAIVAWSTTGEVTGVPEGLSANMPGATSPASSKTTASTMSNGSASATPAEGEEASHANTVMFKERQGGAKTANNPAAIRAQLGPGYSLDGTVKSHMETAFGMDFSQVRVHADTGAAGLSESLNARAFTVGEHVAFGAGEYQPGTLIGDALIAHELAHVVQQSGASAQVGFQQKGDTEYNTLEADADTSAIKVMLSSYGVKGSMANFMQNAMPHLRVGLKLQRCSISSPNELTEEQKQKLFVEATKKQFSADLDKQLKSVNLDLQANESKSLQMRIKAVEMKLLPQSVLDAWYTAQTLILTNSSSLRSGNSDDATKAPLKKALGDFYSAFDPIVASLDVVKGKESVGKFGSRTVYENKYLDPRVRGRVYDNLKNASSASDWLDVLSDFRTVSGAMDLYIADKFREQARREEIANFKDASQKAQAVVDTMKTALKRGTPDKATRLTTVQTLKSLYISFRTAVAPYDYEASYARKGMMAARTYIANPYHFTQGYLAVLLNDLEAAESNDQWEQVFKGFEEVRKYIDEYIAAGSQVTGRSEEAETLVYQGDLARGVAALLEKHPQAEKIQAMFYPETQKENVSLQDFQVKGVPLYFFLYREGNEWHLVDLTTPRQEKANSESGGTQTKPPVEDLFWQLNSRLRFPKGILYWRMRDGTDWTMPTTVPIRLSEWLSWIGLGAAAIGLTLATFGTGTVAVVGAWFLAGSALASGASAAADLAERSKQGMLDTSTLIIDVSQIVASIASIGAFAAERIVTRALSAAEANAPFTGTKASIAAFSQKIYVPLVGTRLAADTVSFIVMTDELFKQMTDIQGSTTMDQREKDRLKTMILTRLAFGAGMMILNVKGALHDFEGNKRLVLEEWGNMRVALAGEQSTILHSTTPGIPRTTFTRTQFKLSSPEQVEYLLTNVKGLTREQAEFLVTEMRRYRGALIFGGSRVSGSPQTEPGGKVTSDLDVGFEGMTRNQFRRLMNDFNRQFTGRSQGPGRIIEHEWIFPGSKPRSVPEIVSPEEFFLRSGVRGPGDAAKAGQPFGPSGYLKLRSDGTAESGRP